MAAPDLDTKPPETEPAEAEPARPDVLEPGEWTREMRHTLDELEKVQRARTLFSGSNQIESGQDYPVAQALLEGLENGLKAEFAIALVNLTMSRSEGWDPYAK